MKKTALTHIHESLGARMVEFAGFRMPVEYSGINDEHVTVRTGAGVFDVSHMGEIWVKGPKALDFVQWVTSNDASKLSPGKAQYSCFPNGSGGIVDDLLVYMYEEEKYMLVVNAACLDKDWEWLNKQNKLGAELENSSDRISQLAVQGPKATAILQKLTEIDLSEIKYFSFVTGNIAGEDDVIISATGYTGAGGFELYFSNDKAENIWNRIFDAGKDEGIKPIGLAARDTLRLEMGYCLYGNDIDSTTSPIEAGLGWITKFTDNKEFIDKELFKSQKAEGVTRKLIGFEMIDRGIPRHGYEIVDSSNNIVGNVTSGTMSPMMKTGIGMGYVKKEISQPEQELFIKIRNKVLKAKIVSFPIYKG